MNIATPRNGPGCPGQRGWRSDHGKRSTTAPAQSRPTAFTVFRRRVTPVVVLEFPAGGDNHADGSLENEITETIRAVDGMRILWEKLVEAELAGRVTFATLDVFGRTLRRNASGGRGHNDAHHGMVMAGPKIKPGVVGGVDFDGNQFRATPIGDVPADQTLESAGKTLMKAVGIADDRLSPRIAGGRVVDSALR